MNSSSSSLVGLSALLLSSIFHVQSFAPSPSLIPSLLSKKYNNEANRNSIVEHYKPLDQTVSAQRTNTVLYDAGSGNFFRKPKQNIPDDEDDDDEEEDDEDASLYEQFASSEFLTDEEDKSSSLARTDGSKRTDWGGEYDMLRDRALDQKSGQNTSSKALFRLITMSTPSEAITKFVSTTNPEVVTAMSAAVSSLLGGLASGPLGSGVETIVKANGEKLGSLCFQLQMTGYMFRNAEYVLAIKDLMNIQGSATVEDYKRAFDKLDQDNSGYIESDEVEVLLADVYGNEGIPPFEVDVFLKFFDSNRDGKISWGEFERGLGVVAENRKKSSGGIASPLPGLPGDDDLDDDEEEEELLGETDVSGNIQIEFKSGKVLEVSAREYIDELKKEAEALKEALRIEKGGLPKQKDGMAPSSPLPPSGGQGQTGGITGYIASLQGDFKSLTKDISPDVVDAMKLVVDYVIDGGPSSRGNRGNREENMKKEMEIPGSALQQLALWQLVLGYQLREAEATGEYRKMLEE